MMSKLLLLIIFSFVRDVESAQAQVKLENNGYVNIVVAITDKVPESASTIQTIQDMITAGSKALYVATENRAYIRDVTIVVPPTYTGTYGDPGTANIGSADIIVDAYNANDPYGHSPYVKHYSTCGKPGQFIHYTDQFITDNTINSDFGLLDTTFVHEWAHYRYGVFDEAPRLDENGNYVFVENDIKQYCMEWRLKDFQGNLIPDIKPNKPASIMTFTSHSSIKNFCGSTPQRSHNSQATNNQNTLCGESVWETIMKHEDFANGNNPTSHLPENQRLPTFTVVKQQPKRVVFVLDVSGSMGGTVGSGSMIKMELLKQAATQFLMDEDVMPNNVHIGIAKFATNADQVVPMMQVRSAADRQTLANGIATLVATTSTAIGKGILKGIEMIEAYNQGVAGAELMVLTDGQENVSPHIADVQPEVLNKTVVVHSILYTAASSPENHDLSKLAVETNGKDQYVSGDDQSGLFDAFKQVFECDNLKPGEICSNASQLVQSPVYLSPLGLHDGTFTIDYTVGSKTAIRATFDSRLNPDLDITARSPTGTHYSRNNADYFENATFGTAELGIPNIAEEGKWTYEVRNTRNTARQVQVYVKSGPRNSSVEPVSISLMTSSGNVDAGDEANRYLRVYTDVRQGPSPILGADVVASVTDKRGLVHRVNLYDTGTGADVNRHDGVYSGYFMNYTSDGAYTFSADITTTKNSRIKTKGSYGVFPMGAVEKGKLDILKSEYKEAPQMSRQQKGNNYVTVENAPTTPLTDLAPPARIVDLAVRAVNHDSKTHNLTFTAVGDDMDIGTASQYDMRYANDLEDLKTNFPLCEQIQDHHVLSGSSLSSPRPSGDIENFRLDMSFMPSNQSVFYAVKAIDKVNKTGDRSNTPSVKFSTVSTTTPHTEAGFNTAVLAACLSVVSVSLIAIIGAFICYQQKSASKRRVGSMTSVEVKPANAEQVAVP